MKSKIALVLLFCCVAATAAEVPATPPVEDLSLVIPDPYRWMEGEGNAKFDAWLRAEGASTRSHIDALPTLAAWRERLGKAAGATTANFRHARVAGRLFYLREEPGHEAMLKVRDADGKDRVVYDPNAEPGASISNFSVSPDGRLSTINVSRGGSEIGKVELREVDSGRLLADTLEPVWSEFNPSWLPDGSGFAYTRLAGVPGADPLLGMTAYLHRLGQPQSADLLLARADGSSPLGIASESFPIVAFNVGSDWATLQVVGARAAQRVCVAPRSAVVAGKAKWRCLFDVADDVQGIEGSGDWLYVFVAGATPNRRVARIDLHDGKAMLAQAQAVLGERKNVVLVNFGLAKGELYVSSTVGGIAKLERADRDGSHLQPLTLPFPGSMELHTSSNEPGAIVLLTGWTRPSSAFDVAAESGITTDMQLGTSSAVDHSSLIEEELEAISADGTRVPLSVVHRKDLAADGHAIALLEGYGGYGISIDPEFSPNGLEWARAGNVRAYCHVRGGGEKGDAWRLGGVGANKQRGVEDFIACAQVLATHGLSRPGRTVGICASMGGVLCGGAYTTAPEAFGGMAITAGILNPVRLLAAKNGSNQIAELGDPRTTAGVQQLQAMDPTLRLRDGVRYPPLLLIVGLADQRVAPWNSGKFASRVLAASPRTPVWIRTDDAKGHFSTTFAGSAVEKADIYSAVEAFVGGP